MPRIGAAEGERRLTSDHCSRRGFDRPCPGTSEAVLKGLALPHRDALHAVHAHYIYANQSLLRFRSAARGDYAADLVFEIDAHGSEPDFPRLTDYTRFIEPAVLVGRRIYDFLVEHLDVAPGWVTTAITRMGATVCVDWRAFGPRRLWELLVAIRWIEHRTLAGLDRGALDVRTGTTLKVDTAMYEPSDVARRPGQLGAHWLRPLGALHAKSSITTAFFRKTPCPHEFFRPERAELLTLASRGDVPDVTNWARPEWLSVRQLLRWPEARWPKADEVLEGKLPLARGLIDLLDRDDALKELPEDIREAVSRVKGRHLGGRTLRSRQAPPEISEETVRRIVERIGQNVRETSEGFQLDCPRAGCKAHGRKAIIYKDQPVFTCFRCSPGSGMSVRNLCAELGLLHLLPAAKASSNPIQRRALESIEVAEERWTGATVIEPSFESLEDARADQRSKIEDFLEDDEARLLVLVARPGIGKTTTVAEVAKRRRLKLRAFLPRDDAKDEFAKLVPDAKLIRGRRSGDNCWNDDLDDVSSRLEPIAESLCSNCDHIERCKREGYLSQFLTLPHQVPLVLHHSHAVHAELAFFDNGATLDFIDEDALDAAVEHVRLTLDELARFRARRAIDAADLDPDGTFGLGGENAGPRLRRAASSPRWEAIVAGLERRLSFDASVSFGEDLGQTVADLQLADLLFRDAGLREAVATLDDHDVEQLRADVLGLRETLSEIRLVAAKATAIAAKAETETERNVYRALATLREDREGLERPVDRATEMVEALRQLLYAWETRQNCTSALQAMRAERGRGWVLRLSTLRRLLPSSKKVIHASASMTAERLKLMHVPPTPHARWSVYRPCLPQREHWTVVGDGTYGKRALVVGKNADKKRTVVFETVRKIIEIENRRTTLPVAVIGPSAVVNAFNVAMLGKLSSEFEMPFRSNRAKRMRELRLLTEPLGYISGYAYGVAGSNEFSVEVAGGRAFVRALIVLGACVPNLDDYAASHRGLFAGVEGFESVHGDLLDTNVARPLTIDWSMAFRTVPVPGTESEGAVTVLTNVPGFADPSANAILAGTFEGELLQIAGRLRADIADPRGGSTQPRVYQFGAAVVPGVQVARVVGLDELRTELGLRVEDRPARGRKPELPLEDRYRLWRRKDGKPTAIRRLVAFFVNAGSGAPLGESRALIREIGDEWGREEAAIALKAMKRALGSPPNSL